MKRIQAIASPDAVERIRKALGETGLCITAKALPVGGKLQKVILYVKDEEAIAVIMILKRAVYAKGSGNGKISIHGVNIPAQLTT